MYRSTFNFRTLTLSFIALFAFIGTSFATTSLDGTWINRDANTSGLTKVVISSSNRIFQAFGKCHPNDCVWDRVRMQGRGNSYKAYYNQGFAKRVLSIAKLNNGLLCVIMKTDYKDRRKSRRDTYYFRKKVRPNVSVRPAVKEDCVKVDYRTAKLRCIKGNWTIVDGPQGRHAAFSFGNKVKEARKALRIIKQYKVTQSCFVGRPGPSLEYLLRQGKAPTGAIAQEDCVSFNPRTIKVKRINGRYKIVDGSHWVFDFGNSKAEAVKSLNIIKKHGFTKSCYVGRPGPSFEYMRK
ncbi:MAG: hypothetical protein AAF990_22995 [Bacteroidota bacterium]